MFGRSSLVGLQRVLRRRATLSRVAATAATTPSGMLAALCKPSAVAAPPRRALSMWSDQSIWGPEKVPPRKDNRRIKFGQITTPGNPEKVVELPKYLYKPRTYEERLRARRAVEEALVPSQHAAEVYGDSRRGARLLYLNRPKALNALNIGMIRRVWGHLMAYEKNPLQFYTVMLSTTAPKAFCAGGDVKTLCEYVQRKARGLTDPEAEDPTEVFFREEYRLNFLTSILSKPLIPIMDGITMGGGVGLSVHAPFTVATENTLFAMPETAIGFIPDVGATYTLAHLPLEGMGMFLGLTGFRLKGADVVHAGIASHYMPSEAIEGFTRRLGESDGGFSLCELTLENSCVDPDDDGLGFGLKQHLGVIAHCFGREVYSVEEVLDRLKGVASDSAQGQAQRDFAQALIKAIGSMSPTALKLTFSLLRMGESSTLSDCLKREFNVVQHLMAAQPTDEEQGKPPSDFVTGVHSKLIAKTKGPVAWYPPTLAEVSDNVIDRYARDTPIGIDPLELPSEKDVHERPGDRTGFTQWNMKFYEPVGDKTPLHQAELQQLMAEDAKANPQPKSKKTAAATATATAAAK